MSTNMLEFIFSAMGVDYLQFRVLLKNHIKLDFRSQKFKGTGRASTKKYSFIMSLIFYLLPSFMIAGLGVQKSDLFGFSFITISLSMIFIVLAIIIEFNEIILNPEESEILTFRPVSSRTYFWVKMANLFFYITLIGLALNIPPAFFGLVFKETRWHFPIVYLLVTWFAQIATASFVIILYSFLVRIFNYERLKDILAYIQVIFTFIIFIGYQFLMRLTAKIAGTINLQETWNYFAPPAWYGSVITAIYSPAQFSFYLLAGLAVLFTLFTLTFALRNLSLDYAQTVYKLTETSRQREKVTNTTVKQQSLFSRIQSVFIRNSAQLVGYNLVSKYLRRSRSMRTRIFPSFAMPLVMIGLFIIDGEFKDPFLPGAGIGTFMPLLFLIWVAVFFYQIIPTSDDWKASWIYFIVPIENYVEIYWGSMKAVILKYITPYFVFVSLVLSVLMPVHHALLICLFNYVFFISYYIFMTFFLEYLPLSKKYERGQSNTRFMLTFILFPIFAIGGFLEYFVFQEPWLIPVGLLGLILFGWLSAKTAGKRFDERIRRQEFIF